MKNRETFKVFQILLTSEEIAKVNAEGHGSVPKHSARTDMHFSDNPQTIAFDAMEKGYYTHVANITTDRDLEGVFEIGNSDNFLNGLYCPTFGEILTRMHSISVGDVIECENGDQYVVAEVGFKRLPIFAFPAEEDPVIEKVNVRKLNPVQRKACDLLRLFGRRAGWDIKRDIVYPIMSGENKGGMMVIQPELDWMRRLEDKLSTR